MIGLGECRSANVDGLPWQLSLLPTGYCNVRGNRTSLGRQAGLCPRIHAHVFVPHLLREADMNMRISQLNGANSAGYFDRLPEKLVLEGYRRWTAGFETGSIIPWEMTWGLYSEVLGPSEAKRALGELSHFIRVLRHCASCPLRAFPFDSHHVCREECLTLGLISGIHNQDALLLDTCLEAIACRRRCDDVAGLPAILPIRWLISARLCCQYRFMPSTAL